MTSHLVLLERETDIYVASEQAARLADEAGFDHYACGDIETAASEICSNALRHADGGWVAIRRLADRFEVSVTDRGPGFDGPRKSTPGLGVGLEGARRLMGALAVERIPEGSRVTASRTLAGPRDSPAGRWSVLAAFRSRSGHALCGDAMAVEMLGDGIRIGVADGLGSGLHASLAAKRVLEGMDLSRHHSPSRALAAAHLASRNTRGAAATALLIDGAGRGLHAALGDVSCMIMGQGELVGRPGMVGHGHPAPIDTAFELPSEGTLLVWTDGVRRPQLDGKELRPGRELGLEQLEEIIKESGNTRDDGALVAVQRWQ